MSGLEEIKKAFPNMFRPLKWQHFEGKTEHGCGEWYAHATRGIYHIYDVREKFPNVREKFPNDRPFYAKELSDQFDTLKLAQEAYQNRHESDIVMCLDHGFLSTLESLHRENEALKAIVFKVNDIRNSIIGCQTVNWSEHIYPLVSALEDGGIKGMGYPAAREIIGTLIERTNAAEARAEAAEAEVKRLRGELAFYSCDGSTCDCISGQEDANSVTCGFRARTALASTGGEHNGN